METKNNPRIYVGTLYSNENEFEDCVRSIQQQTYQHFDHYIFKNLPNKEAHVALFKSFVERAKEYAFLIKVDADMVLSDPALFEKIVKKMEELPDIEILTIAVDDFFSDQLIFGLNTYRNTVHWDFAKENLFVDIPNVPRERYFFDDKELAPAATHCSNPSPFQALHYGVHRGLKVIQLDQESKKESSRRAKWTGAERTWVHYLQTDDTRLGLACLGAELAYAGFFQISDLDITNPNLGKILIRFIDLDNKALHRKVSKFRFLNFGFLPSSKRRKLICLMADQGRKNPLLLRIIPK